MKVLGTREVAFSKIKAPGDIKKRMTQAHVVALAASMKETIPLQDMVVRQRDWKLIAGRDRYAGHLINEATKVWVKLVDCTDREMKTLERHENIHRRHDAGERMRLMAEEVEKLTETIAKEQDIPVDGAGRRKTAKGIAREQVAQKFGTTTETVRSNEYRTKKRQESEAPGVALPPIRTLGMKLEDTYLKKVAKIQSTVDECAEAISASLGAFTRLAKDGEFPEGKLQRIKAVLQEASNLIRGNRPDTVCPSCKCIGAHKSSCGGCGAVGWVGKSALANVPEALLREEDPVILVDGKLVPAADFFEPSAEDLFG